MTIQQFQNIHNIALSTLSEEDKAILFVQEVTGYSEAQVNSMRVSIFNKLCSRVHKALSIEADKLLNSTPKQYISTNGRTYRLNYDIKRKPFNSGKYVEIATFADDVISNLHKILASMATPVKFNWRRLKYEDIEMEHEDIANDFLKAEFKHAYHAGVFFYAVFNESMKALQPYFLKEMSLTMNPEAAKQILLSSQNTLDGFTMPKWYQNLKISA